MFNRRYIFKWLVFHCHVSFRGCTNYFCINYLPSLKLTWPLKMVVSNRNLLFQGSIFRCYVSFRDGTCAIHWMIETMFDLHLVDFTGFRWGGHHKRKCKLFAEICWDCVLSYGEKYCYVVDKVPPGMYVPPWMPKQSKQHILDVWCLAIINMFVKVWIHLSSNWSTKKYPDIDSCRVNGRLDLGLYTGQELDTSLETLRGFFFGNHFRTDISSMDWWFFVRHVLVALNMAKYCLVGVNMSWKWINL